MTLAADRWPSFTEPAADRRSRFGAAVVWRLELAKLGSLLRVRAIAVLCLIVPFLAVAGLNLQTATPRHPVRPVGARVRVRHPHGHPGLRRAVAPPGAHR